MLEIARGKARDAGYDLAFIHDDMRELPTNDERRTTNDQQSQASSLSSFVLRPASFALVTCFYDSLNYLIDDGDLDDIFAGVAASLRPGGHVLFDINTEVEYMTWDERDVVVYDGHDCLVYNKLNYEPESCLAEGRIVWFVRETELWWRGEETHVQRAWSDDEVCGALARAGLTLVGLYDVAGNTACADTGRVLYVARKSPERAL
jgi:SAM-dependent methyltransferase